MGPRSWPLLLGASLLILTLPSAVHCSGFTSPPTPQNTPASTSTISPPSTPASTTGSDGGAGNITPLPPLTTTPPGNGSFECSYEGDILTYFNYTSDGVLSRNEGEFEICIGGRYGSVCDIGWDEAAAQALCRDRFGSNYVAEPLYGLGYPRRRYVAQNFNCSDFAYGLRSCTYNDAIDPECFNGPHVAGVRCRETCYEGEVRLFNSNYTYDNGLQTVQGHVLLCFNGSFLPVCDLGWDNSDAQVVCNQRYGSNYIGEVYSPSFPLNYTSIGAVNYVAQDVMCNGTEYSVSQCDFSPPSSACYEGNRAAGVICREVCSNGVVRLVNQSYINVGGLSSTGGIVQVCVNQQFGYICADDWDDREADVVCRSQSSSYRAPYYENTASMTSMVFGDAPVYRYSMCNGTEYNFNECQLPIPDADFTCPSFAAVNCTEVISQCYSDGEFRLFNESTNFTSDGSVIVTGRIEVCANFSFTSLCYQYWNPVDAQVFCTNLLNSRGYYSFNITGYPTSPSQYGYSNAGIVTYNVICNGSESRVEDCYRFPGSSPFCEDPATSAAGVVCVSGGTVSPTVITPSCSDFSLQLTNQQTLVSPEGLFTVEGNIEVCVGGSYLAVCDEGWDDLDARVACTALGYDSRSFNATALRGLFATAQIGIENVMCFGDETSASQCNVTAPVLTSRCFNRSGSAAGVRCAQVGDGVDIPEGFLPFGLAYGDSVVPSMDDGSSEEIQLETDVFIFGSRGDSLYVNTNGVLSLGQSFTNFSSYGSNFGSVSTPPIIAPFWDDIDITRGGAIYYRQDSSSFVVNLVRQEVSSQYPEIVFFFPSSVFVATWDRVAPFNSSLSGVSNTFQCIVASDGALTFVRFIYDDIQWGGSNTLIGVSAGDGFNFISHPASLSSSILSIDNTSVTYRVDTGNSTVTPTPPTTTTPPGNGSFECSYEGDILTYFNYTSDGVLSRNEGEFEICIGGRYGSVCDIGWDEAAAQALCRDRFGSNYVAEPLYGLGYPRRRYVAQNFNCSDFAYGLRSCTYNDAIDPECFNGPHVAGVRCRETCYEGEVRLFNSNYTYNNGLQTVQGHVLLCFNGSFLPVCDLGWDNSDAQVVCNQRYGSNYIGEVYSPSFPLNYTSIGAVNYVAQDVMCNGTEYSVSQCDFSPPSSACYEGNRAAGVICREVCSNGVVRLVNQSYINVGGLSSTGGIVQVCVNQQFGYICADGWDDREADVVCRSQSSSYQAPYYENTASTTSMVFGDAPVYRYSMCNGTEYNFNECQLPIPDVGFTCPSFATVNCTEVISQCYSDGEFRLSNESTNFTSDGSVIVTGRIEVCANFSFTSLCYQYWDPVDAQVFCTNLLNSRGYYSSNITGYPTSPSQYGYSNAGIVTYNVICNGSESRVEDCYRFPGSSPFCEDPATSAAGVVCVSGGTVSPTVITPSCSDFSLQLTNQQTLVSLEGLFTVEGNIEVCVGGSYLAVCDEGWDDLDARVACTALGYDSRSFNATALRGLFATAQIGIENVMCFGDETSASQCNVTAPVLTSRCFNRSGSAAGVRCAQVGDGVDIPEGFLPFGLAYGDSVVPSVDDGSSEEIQLETDVFIFGSRGDSLYVNTNGVLSLGQSFTNFSSYGSNFGSVSTPPIIAPFWDDIDITRGGAIYYRQDSSSFVVNLVRQEVSSQYPEIVFFFPSSVFVATWDRVAPFNSSLSGVSNTFQCIVASDGVLTFVRFIYDDIQWGGSSTLIGVSAGDGFNFISHPASLSSSILSIDNTSVTYRVDTGNSTVTPIPPLTTSPPGNGSFECSYEGDILTYFNYTSDGVLSRNEGEFEICIGGRYGSVCDIGWDEAAAQALCRDRFGSNYVAEPLYGLGYPRRRYVAQNFNCSDFAYGLRSCTYNDAIDPECFNGPHVAGVRCRETCYEGEVRLFNSNYTYDNGLQTVQGHVLLCFNGSFLPVCDLGWDNSDAQVVCNQRYGSNYIGEVYSPNIPLNYTSIGAITYVAQDVMCNGTEYSVSQCNFSPPSSACYEGNRAAGVICREVCSNGVVRLVNQSYINVGGLSSTGGIVQVCVNQQFGYICADGWDDREADVVCRSQSSSYRAPYYENTASTTSMVFGDVPVYRYSMCNGTEYNFNECQLPIPDADFTCPSFAAVNCTEVISQCYSDGEFRLSNESTNFTSDGSVIVTGRIEVCANFSFTSLCYQYWDSVDAQVFCTDYLNSRGYYSSNITGYPTSPSQYGYSNAGIVTYNVICNGSESRVEDCYQFLGSSPFCDDPATSAAGVVCVSTGTVSPTVSTPSCSDFSLQLTNQQTFVSSEGLFTIEGNIEVCVGGSYLAVCDEGWDDRDARVACTALGYDSRSFNATALSGRFATAQIGVENVMCFGDEASASQCNATAPVVTPRCFNSSGSAAGVRCTQVDNGTVTPTPPGNGTFECTYEGDIISYFNSTPDGLTSQYEGEFEICIGGFYGSVCDIGWDEAAAQALCRDRFGYNYVAEPLYGLGYPGRRYVAQNFSCPGFVYGLRNCNYSSYVDLECYDEPHVAGVRCRQTCADGDVRLLNETTDFNNSLGTYRGQVLVCVNGSFRPICDFGWDDNDAQVVCILRYGPRFAGEASFGFPSYPNVTYVAQDVMCNGTEFSISQCSFSPPSSACYAGNRGAGVICREVCSEGDVRLVNANFGSINGFNSVFGVVQVCVNQQYGYVCSEGWDNREAEVACRTYNYNYQPPFYQATASTYVLLGDAPLYHNAMCNGTEESFYSCQLPYSNTLISCPSIGAVTCTEAIAQCSYDGQFRLANPNTTALPDGSTIVFGRVEVCANFTYGSVCDYGWDQADADVFCRSYAQNVLGIYSGNITATPVGGSVYGYSNTGIVLEDVMCTSFESLIDVCSRSPFYNFTQPQCQYEATNSAGVICTIPGAIPPPTCQQFDLRLTNQTTYTTQGFYQVNEGNVETCINGSYHSICDIGFDDVEAQLICNALGYSAPFYRGVAVGGLIATAPTGLENLMCPSDATSALNCTFVSPPVSSQCYNNLSAAGVRCIQERSPCQMDGEFSGVNITYEDFLGQFSGGGINFIGRVGVCVNGIVGSVCDINWDQDDASVFCNGVLGVVGDYVGTPLYGFNVGPDPIVLESVDCNGMESSISACQISQLGVVTNPTCQDPNRAAGVRCSLATGSCIDGQARLVDGPAFNEGRLEVCSGNQWLSVCDAGFDTATAYDVCNSRLLLFGDATAVYGGVYGQGTGPLLTACSAGNFSFSTNFVPFGNCTTMSTDLSCSHERDVGVRCNPGLLSVLAVPVGRNRYGYPAALQCFAQQFPWEASLVSNGWYDNDGNPVVEYSRGGPVNVTLLQDMYNPDAINLTYTFRNQLNFNHPLSVSDGGYYSCNVSVELTYPDNSTVVLYNSSVVPLVIEAPEPTISLSSTGSQIEGSRFEGYCFVYLPSPELANFTFIEWVDSFGSTIPDQPRFRRQPTEYRIQVLPIQQVNDTHLMRQIVVDPLLAIDERFYACQAYFAGQFVTSPLASVPVFLDVFGVGGSGSGSGFPTDVPVVTTPEARCNDFDVRLANESFSGSFQDNNIVYAGTVETCFNGSYFTVCDIGWDDLEAQFTCNALGYFEPYFRGVAVGGLIATAPIAFENVTCPSDATSALNCSFVTPPTSPRCYRNFSAAGVRCIQELVLPTPSPEPPCNDFDLRLTNTSFTSQDVFAVYEGNVEICINGSYVAICDLGWDNVEAQLACNIVGYGEPFFRGTALSGLRATAPIGVENVMCSSNATSPAECPAVAPPETSRCYDSSSAAGVRCISQGVPRCNDFDLRLANMSVTIEDNNPVYVGVVETCFNGSYFSVCDIGWDDVEAQLICNALGYIEPYFRGVAVGGLMATAPAIFENVMCPSDATSVTNCSFVTPPTSPRCYGNFSAAGVRCILVEVPTGTPEPRCNDFDLRLTNTSFTTQDVFVVYEGNVEICFNGSYVAICDLGWDNVEAQLACNIVGYGEPLFRGTALSGLRATAPIGVENVMCSSNATSPAECPAVAPPETSRCYGSSSAAGVRCTQVLSQCFSDGEFRLANFSNVLSPDGSSGVISGRVEVCYNGTYGSVCDNGWDEPEARVLCTNFLSNLFGIPTDAIFGANAVGGSLYGYSLAGIVLENVACEGFESSLGGCSYPPLGQVVSPQCQNPSTDAAGVMCSVRIVTPPPGSGGSGDGRPDVFVFGPEVGDQTLPLVDDGSSPEIVLNTSFVFFGYSYTSLYVSTNGILSFESSFTRFQPTPFPFISPPLIAPFWADFDLRKGGNVYYRQTTQPDILQQVSFTASQISGFQFEPTLAFIATWDGVPAFDGRFRGLTNTFQVVLATNGSHSFAGFIYRDIQWGSSVQIGFNAGDGRGYTSPLTLADVQGNGRESNVMIQGVYVYRTDNLTSPEPPTTVEPPSPTTPPLFCSEGYLRQVSSNYSSMRSIYGTYQTTAEFRFEVCVGDQFASVCDVGWDDRDAAVVCTELGYSDATATVLLGLAFSRQEEIYGIQGVECNGTEYELRQCQNSTMISDECLNGSHVAGVRCVDAARPCYHSDMRPVNVTYSNIVVNGEYLSVVEGTFDQCIDGFLGPVCDIGWDDRDATALCRRFQGSDYIGEAILGFGSSNSYIGQDFMCNGTEYNGLVECSYSNATESCYGQHVAGFRCRQMVPRCNNGDYRVQNGTFVYDNTDLTSYSGRIEVCVDGSYIALCDSGFTMATAELACRSDGYRPPFFRAEVLTGAFADFYSGPVYNGRFNCSGSPYNFYDCQLVPGNDESCSLDPSRAVGFKCVRELLECYSSDGQDFRLFDGEFNYFIDSGFRATGRVDVCFNRTYGSVCSQGWDDYDAMAFCRYNFGNDTMGRAINGSEFGISPIGIVLTDVKCSGDSRESITDCAYGELDRAVGATAQCSGEAYVAGVICSRECYDGNARLGGSEAYYEGRVEVCHNSRWRTICDIGWDDIDATIACRSIQFFNGGEAINGSMFGSSALSFGASDVQCFGREFLVGECRNETIIPDECTANRVAGVRCTPGSIVVEIVSEGVPRLGSNGYTVQCNAFQHPWNSQLIRYRWNNTADSQLMSDSRLNISLLNSTYDVYERTFVFNSSIQFNPLTFQDAGYITCGLALNLTYPDGPDNSSIVIMNRTTSIITIDVPLPSIEFTREVTPINNRPYTATCVVRFVAAVPVSMVTIEWMNQEGVAITDITDDGRITVSPIRQIDDRTYARDVIVNPLRIEDSGLYICEAALMGEFITSEAASEEVDLVVFGQAEIAIDQEIVAVVLNSPTSTGDDVTFVCSVFGSPYHPNATWQYIGPGGSDSLDLPDSITPVETEISATNLTSTITIQDVQFSSRGVYRCTTGTGLYDDVRLVVAVTPQLTVSSEPASTNLTEQDSLNLVCSSSEYYSRTSISWFKSDTPVNPTSRIDITETFEILESGLYQTQSNLSIASTLTSDSGAYYCKAILQVDGRSQPVTVRADGDINILVQARNECIISPSPELVTPCVNGYCIDGVGDYSCICNGGFQGRNCSEPIPDNQEPVVPTIISPPISRAYLLGDFANISCLASGVPAPTYRWFFNDELIDGEIFPYLIISSIAPEHRGVYYCIATNEAGSIESVRAQITIEGVQQYRMAFEEPSRRRRQSDTVTMFLNSLVGTPLGDTGVTIYAAEYQAGSILVTLNAGGSGEFPEVGLTDSLQAAAAGVAQNFGITVTGVQRFDGCPSEDVDGFIWPESDLNLLEPIRVSCNCGRLDTTVVSLQAIRNCTGSYTGGASWMGRGNSTACQFSSAVSNLCGLSAGTTEVAVASVLALTQNSTAVVDPTSVTIAVTILSQNTSALQDETVRTEVVDSLSNLQNVSRSTLQESQNNAAVTNLVITVVEDIAESIPLDGQMPSTVVAANKGLAITAVAPDVNTFRGVSFEVNFNDDGSIKEADASLSASSEAPTSLSIPQSLFEDLGLSSDDITDLRVGFSVFRDDSLFQPRSEAEKTTMSAIGSSVISAQVSGLGVEVSNLENPVIVELNVKPFSNISDFARLGLKEEDYDRTMTCVFWDPSLDNGFGNWSSEGCQLTNAISTKAFCECDHLTSFALLMDVSPKPIEESPVTFALEIITYIGLAASIIGLLLTIITYLVVKKLRTSDVGQMLLNLCFALLGLYVAFLISTSAESLTTTEGRNACGFFSALLHYFMLAYFFWTAAEALFLFFKLVRVLHGSMNTYVYVAMAVCWVTPVIIVAISLGGYQYYLSDSFCRPTEWPFWFGFVAPFALIYAFNWVMFVVIMVALCMHSKRTAVMSGKDTNMKSVIAKHLLIAVVLSLLFGLGWAFGLIGTSSLPREAYLPAQYIFSIFMGIQGVLIFFLHAVRSQEAREEWKKWWYTITCRSSTYEMKRRATFTVTSSRGRVTTLESSMAPIEKSMPYHEAEEAVPLSPVNPSADKLEKEMQATAETSTTVENVYVSDPTGDGELEKVDLSSDAERKSPDETSKL